MSLHKFLTRLIWLCVLPLILLAAGLATIYIHQEQRQRERQAEQIAKNFITTVDNNLGARIGALQMLSMSPLADDTAHRKSFYAEAQRLQQGFGSHVILGDLERRMLFNTRAAFGTALPMMPIPKGHNAALTAMTTGKPAVGDLFLGPVAHQWMIGIAVPGLRDGKVTFILSTTIDVGQFQRQLDQESLPNGWTLTLQDGDSNVIGRKNTPDANADSLVDTSKHFIAQSLASPWSVSVGIPKDIYFRPLFEATGALILAILGATMLGVIGGRVASRKLAKSVASLAEASSTTTAAPGISEIADVRALLDEAAYRRDKAEMAQRASEEHFRATFEHASVGIALLALDGRWLNINQRLCDIVGYARSDLLNKKFRDITYADDIPRDIQSQAKMIAGEMNTCTVEKRYIHQSGEVRWINLSTSLVRHPDGSPNYFVSMVENIQPRKVVEAELLVKEIALKEAQRIAGIGIWSWDLRTDHRTWSPEMYTLYGVDPEQTPPAYPEIQAYYTPESWIELEASVRTALAEGGTFICNAEIVRPDGTHRWMNAYGEAMRDETGAVVEIHAIVQDISTRKLAEDELTQHRHNLEELVSSRTTELAAALADSTMSRQRMEVEIKEHMSAEERLRRSQMTLNQAARIAQFGAWSIELKDIHNFGSNPVTWSAEMYRLFDYKPDEIPNLRPDIFFERIHPDDRTMLMDTALQALSDNRIWQTEFRLVMKDGSERRVVETGEFSFDDTGKPQSMHGALRDITEQRQIEAQLLDSEARLRMALEGAGAGGYEWNRDSKTGIWSEEIWALLGIASYATGEDFNMWQQAVHPDDRSRIQARVEQAMSHNVPYEVEWRVHLPKGDAPRWLMERARPVHESDGRIIRYRGIVMDIAERKQAELTLELYREHLEERVMERTTELSRAEAEQRRLNRSLRLISHCTMALVHAKTEAEMLEELCRFIVETGGYLMAWVGMAEQDETKSVRLIAKSGDQEGYLDRLVVSWDGTQAIGRGPTGSAIRTGTAQIIHDSRADPRMAPWHEAILKRGYNSCVSLPLTIENQVVGALTIFSLEESAFSDDEVQLLSELTRDMAFGLQSLRARQELDRYQRQLEARVIERTQEIATLNTELVAKVRGADSANTAKSVFLATMSHELRTPLNAVVGLTGLLADSPLDRRQRDYADKIQLSAQALRALIDDILDFSKIEARALKLEHAPFSLNAVLRTTAAIMGVSLRNKPIEALFEVAPDTPDALVGDALRLQQVLLNLTGNAVKFTQSGVIVLSVECLDHQPEKIQLQFKVRDSGIGIAPEQLGLIFEGFAQADASTSRMYGGSGLGLAISSRLVHLMGGQIQVTSTEGVGSEFCFAVPLTKGSCEPETVNDEQLTNLRILIVDDHALAREVLTQSCANFGWQATALGSGAAGLEELRRSSAEGLDYDLLLLDWRMSDMDGLDMLRRAYATPGLGLPLVVLMAPTFELDQAVAASDDLYLDGIAAKPMTPASLYEAVARAYAGEIVGTLPPAGKTDRRLAGMRLLVAEDNELNQEVIEQILTRAGAEVVLVINGVAAVAALRDPVKPFDAVLMDIQMPIMDGYTATRIIREDLGLVDLPIIAVTAFARPEDREKTRLAGMVGHIVKPLDVEDLLDIVTRKHQDTPSLHAAVHRPATPPVVPSLHLPGLAADKALQIFGGDGCKYVDLLRKFLVRHGGDLEDARKLYLANDVEGAISLLHGLKGMSSFLQATEIAHLATTTEAALINGDVAAVPLLFIKLLAARDVLEESVTQLEALLTETTPP